MLIRILSQVTIVIIAVVAVFVLYTFPLNADMVACIAIPGYGIYRLGEWMYKRRKRS